MAIGLGIDIGSESIKVVQVNVSGGNVTVTGALRIPRSLPAPILDAPVPEDDDDEPLIPATLGKDLKAAGLRTTGTIGISGREIALRYLTTPPVPPDKLKMFIDMEVGGKLTAKAGAADGAAVTYDYRLLNIPSGMKGDLVIMAGVVKNEFLDNVLKMLATANAGAECITPSCFGLVNAYLRTQKIPPKETVVLVDVGHELMELAILEENNLYFARSAPGGGKKFTQGIDKLLKLGPGRAAEYKREKAKLYPEGTPIPSKEQMALQGALKEGAENIASAIRSSIMFCRTQAKMPKLDYSRIFLSGGGARLQGLAEYLEKKAGRPVQVLDINGSVDLRKLDAASARCFEGNIPDMSVALGLAIVDADPKAFHFTLLPEKILRKREFMRKTVFGIAAGIVLAAGVYPPIQNSGDAVTKAEARIAFFEDKRTEASQERKEFKRKVEANKILTQNVDYYARQTRLGRVYLELFNRIRADMPENVTLSYFMPADGARSIADVGASTWNGIDAPMREFIGSGQYSLETYPANTTKFNDAWEQLRQKLLQVPGVVEAEIDSSVKNEATQGVKPFQFRVMLQDLNKPVLPKAAKK